MSKLVPDPFSQQITAALVGMSGFIDGGVLLIQSQASVQASSLIEISVAPPPAVPSLFSGTLVDGGTIGGLTRTVTVEVEVEMSISVSLNTVESLASAAVFVTESPVIGKLAEVFAI